jgi:hypothetical protein
MRISAVRPVAPFFLDIATGQTIISSKGQRGNYEPTKFKTDYVANQIVPEHAGYWCQNA